MRPFTASLILLAVLVTTLGPAPSRGDDPKDKPKPKFTIGKETTYVTGPVDKDGYIDYEAALNERLGNGIKPDDNANVLLWKAFGPRPEGAEMPAEFFKLLGIEKPPERGDYFVDLPSYLKETFGGVTDEMLDQQVRAMQGPWKAVQLPIVPGWLLANKKPLALLIEATKRTHYYHPLVTRKTEKVSAGLMAAPLPPVAKYRELADALTVRAMLHIGEGRTDAAWQDLLAMHRLARLMPRGGTLIEALVGFAIEQMTSSADLAFLANAKLTSAQVQACLRDLQKLPPMPPLADQIDVGERFMFLDSLMLIDQLGMQGFEAGGIPNPLNPQQKPVRPDINWDPALRNGNKMYDRLAAAMRIKARAQREEQLETIETELKNLKKKIDEADGIGKPPVGTPEEKGRKVGDYLLALITPAVRKVQFAADRVEQVQHNLHVAFALAAYVRDQGRYPAKLDELVPKYLPQVPGDVFSGEALIYKPTENDYLLYSVGPNGKDDGGLRREDDPASDDIPVRMPLPEVKR